MLVILEVTKIGFVGKTMLIILSIISSRWLLSLNLDDILSDNSHKTGPISTDNFSIAVSQPLVTALTELFILWVSTSPHIFPDFELTGVINVFQLLPIPYFKLHFGIHETTLSSKLLVSSLFRSVNELRSIWCCTLLSKSFKKTRKREPSSFTRITLSFQDFVFFSKLVFHLYSNCFWVFEIISV